MSDVIMELRENNKRLRYCPYELYMESVEYETTIEKFLLLWENELMM